jgi:hypothetical protein
MGAKKPSNEHIELAKALGADEGILTRRFAIYIPNKDRRGREIGDQRRWVMEATRLLAEINGQATVMPLLEGGWTNEHGETLWENPAVVYSLIRSERLLEGAGRVREFLHRMGRDTNQAEVAFEFDDRLYRISTFD